jgi:hypothetical protein
MLGFLSLSLSAQILVTASTMLTVTITLSSGFKLLSTTPAHQAFLRSSSDGMLETMSPPRSHESMTIWDTLDDLVEFCKRVSKLDVERVIEGAIAVAVAAIIIRYIILPLIFPFLR